MTSDGTWLTAAVSLSDSRSHANNADESLHVEHVYVAEQQADSA